MNRFIVSIAGVCLALVSIGCNQNPATGPDKTVTVNPDAGRFGISHIEGLGMQRADASVKEGENIRFNLGTIKGSTAFFFLLYNVGATPITDVTLSTGTSSFSVYPNSMDTLIPGSDIGMLPIVKISAFHGTPLDGIGTRPVLPMGKNSTELTITGHTKTAAGADTVVELTAQLNLEASVMDFGISMMNGPVNLTKPGSYSLHTFPSKPELSNKWMNDFNTYCSSDSILQFSNTGNTALHVQVFYFGQTPEFKEEFYKGIDTVVTTAGSLRMVYEQSATVLTSSILIIASGNNTVCNPSHLLQNDDGSCYYLFRRTTTECSQVNVSISLNQFVASKKNVSAGKLFAVIDETKIFYAEKTDTAVSFCGLYELSGTPVCERTAANGVLSGGCSDAQNTALLDTIFKYLSEPVADPRKLGLSPERISTGVLDQWK